MVAWIDPATVFATAQAAMGRSSAIARFYLQRWMHADTCSGGNYREDVWAVLLCICLSPHVPPAHAIDRLHTLVFSTYWGDGGRRVPAALLGLWNAVIDPATAPVPPSMPRVEPLRVVAEIKYFAERFTTGDGPRLLAAVRHSLEIRQEIRANRGSRNLVQSARASDLADWRYDGDVEMRILPGEFPAPPFEHRREDPNRFSMEELRRRLDRAPLRAGGVVLEHLPLQDQLDILALSAPDPRPVIEGVDYAELELRVAAQMEANETANSGPLGTRYHVRTVEAPLAPYTAGPLIIDSLKKVSISQPHHKKKRAKQPYRQRR